MLARQAGRPEVRDADSPRAGMPFIMRGLKGARAANARRSAAAAAACWWRVVVPASSPDKNSTGTKTGHTSPSACPAEQRFTHNPHGEAKTHQRTSTRACTSSADHRLPMHCHCAARLQLAGRLDDARLVRLVEAVPRLVLDGRDHVHPLQKSRARTQLRGPVASADSGKGGDAGAARRRRGAPAHLQNLPEHDVLQRSGAAGTRGAAACQRGHTMGSPDRALRRWTGSLPPLRTLPSSHGVSTVVIKN